MLLMRRAGIRSYASHVENDEPGRSLKKQPGSACAAQMWLSKAKHEPCRPQECGMNWSLTVMRAKMALRMSSSSCSVPHPPSPRETVAALWWRSERWEMEGEREWEKEAEERDSSPRRVHLQSVIPLGLSAPLLSFGT